MSSLCGKSIVHFVDLWFFRLYRFVQVVLYVSLRLSLTSTLQSVGDSLGEATVFQLTGY